MQNLISLRDIIRFMKSKTSLLKKFLLSSKNTISIDKAIKKAKQQLLKLAPGAAKRYRAHKKRR